MVGKVGGPSLPMNRWEKAISDLVRGAKWHAGVVWKDNSDSHINILEIRAWSKLMRRLSSRASSHGQRVVSI